MLDDIRDLLSTVMMHWKGLARVSVLWFVLMVIFSDLGGPISLDPMAGGGAQLQAMIYSTFALLSLIMGWFAVHRHLMNPDNARIYPTGPQFRFVGAQVSVITVLTVMATTIVSPLVAYEQLQGMNLMTLGQNWQPPPTPPWVMPTSIFLMMMLFTRLMLTAPMAARGEGKTLRRSWAATKGHFFRLFVLQLLVLLPSGLGLWMQSLSGELGFAITAAALDFASLWLLAALAEIEYSRLGIKVPYRNDHEEAE